MVTVDSHMHCKASEDSEMPITAIFSVALVKGLTAVAITDHVELVDYKKGAYDVACAQSWELMSKAAPPQGLRLLKGIELGEPCFDLPLAERILTSHPYDFVLASQHRLSDELPDYYFIDYSAWSDARVEAEMTRYFKAVLDIVRWNGFDSLAHLTYPFRYLPEKWRSGDYRVFQTVIDEILGRLAENSKSLEINTSGIRKGLGVTSPDMPLIRRFYELGGRHITIGSDAHREREVGADLDAAALLAEQAGFDCLTMYIDRKPYSVAL